MDEDKTQVDSTTVVDDAGKTAAPSQKETRTEAEKAAFTLRKNADRLRELGGDPAAVLGVRPNIQIDENEPDDKPITVRDLREIQKRDAQKTALDMANEIADENEREEVKRVLQSRVVPSGNAQADLDFARGAVNATRNARIAEEAARKGAPRKTAAGGSSPARVEDEFVPTESEKIFMRPPYNMSKEKIIALRQKEQ